MGSMTSPVEHWSLFKKGLVLALSVLIGLMVCGCANSTITIDDNATPMADTAGDASDDVEAGEQDEVEAPATSEYFTSFEAGVGTSQYSATNQSVNVTGGSSARVYIGLKFKEAVKGVDLKGKSVRATISLPEGFTFGSSVSYNRVSGLSTPSKAVIKENGRVMEIPLVRFSTVSPSFVVNCTITASEMVQTVPLTITVDGVSSVTTPSVNVLEPSYTLLVQGTAMAGWYNPASKRLTNYTNYKATFMGSSSNTILEGKLFSFEDLKDNKDRPLAMEGYIAQKVKNQHDGQTWICAGFVPVAYSSYEGSEMYDEFCFSAMDEAQTFIASKQGVLYGEPMTAEQAAAVTKSTVMAVWVIPNEPENLTHYSYGENIVKGTLPVGYEPTTSIDDGVDVTVDVKESSAAGGHYVYTVTYSVTIDERAQGRILNINPSEVPAAIVGAQPGDEVEYRIEVNDRSGKGYEYYGRSGALGTLPMRRVAVEEAIGKGFEGYLMPAPSTQQSSSIDEVFSHRLINVPMVDLFDLSKVDANKPDDESVGKALAALGYGTEGNQTAVIAEVDYEALTRSYLDDYYLDWLNRARNLNEYGEDRGEQFYKSFIDVPLNELDVLFSGVTNTPIPETNAELANAKYYAFYGECLAVEGKGVYQWMNEGTTSADEERAFSNSFDEVLHSQWDRNEAITTEGVTHSIKYNMLLKGQQMGNMLQNTQFAVGVQFKLIRTKGDLRITKAWENTTAEDMTKNGSATAIFRVTGYATQAEADAGEGTEIYRNLVALTFNDPATQERVLTGLPLGFYVVEEIGYEGDNLDDETAAANRTVVEVSATVADPAEVSFTNRHSNERVFGTSVVNTYEASPNNGIVFRNQDPLYRELHGVVA